MKKITLFPTLLLALTFLAFFSAGETPDESAPLYWPQWRGPLGTGVAPQANPPIEWSEEQNIAWKAEIPGKGSATPVIWENMIFLQTAVPVGEAIQQEEPDPSTPRRRGPRGIQPTRPQQFTVLALDRATGRTLWKKVVREQLPHEGTHPTGTWASASPITDGKRLYAYFGSQGLYCMDFEGNVLWEKDFGDMEKRLGFGEGASPALYGDKIVVTWDHQGPSFIVALDKETGEEIWRQEREEITSWSTPLIVEGGGKIQVVTSATNKIRSYDLKNGELIWEATGMTLNAIPTPVSDGERVYLMSGFRGNSLMAISLDARGDVTGTPSVIWSYDRDTSYTPSPLLYQGVLYFLKSNDGVLSTFEAATGKRVYGPVRLDGVPNVYASPVAAADRIYIAGRDGGTVVFQHGREFSLLATNELNDGFDASPVLVDNEIYLRGKRFLYRISEN